MINWTVRCDGLEKVEIKNLFRLVRRTSTLSIKNGRR